MLGVRPNLLLPSGPDRTLATHKFDCVLADVPFTGDGTMLKNPDTKWYALNSSNLQHRMLLLLVQVRLKNPICATDQYGLRLTNTICAPQPGGGRGGGGPAADPAVWA